MDFVISKVCLSICALLILASISQTLDGTLSTEERRDVEIIASQFERLIRTLLERGNEAVHIYRVPSLATGEAVTMTIRTNGVEVVSEHATCDIMLPCPLHLWKWNLTDLNRTDVVELDSSSQPLATVSGDTLRIEMARIPVQSVATAMLFLSLACDPNTTASSQCPPTH